MSRKKDQFINDFHPTSASRFSRTKDRAGWRSHLNSIRDINAIAIAMENKGKNVFKMTPENEIPIIVIDTYNSQKEDKYTAKDLFKRIRGLIGGSGDRGYLYTIVSGKDWFDEKNRDHFKDIVDEAEKYINGMPYLLARAEPQEIRDIAKSASLGINLNPKIRYLQNWKEYTVDELREYIPMELMAQLEQVEKICKKVQDIQLLGKLDKSGLISKLPTEERENPWKSSMIKKSYII